MEKTNAMRILDSHGIEYEVREYSPELTDGAQVAAALGAGPDRVFKTLVTEGSDGNH